MAASRVRFPSVHVTDEEIKTLAERFIAGEDESILRAELCFTGVQFRRVLKMAKAMHPEMDWPSQGPRPESPTNKYVEMKDGKPGTRGVPQGSIVKKRRV